MTGKKLEDRLGSWVAADILLKVCARRRSTVKAKPPTPRRPTRCARLTPTLDERGASEKETWRNPQPPKSAESLPPESWHDSSS